MIKLGALGDIILADGALRDIREQHPTAHITLLTRRNFASMMRRCPWIDSVVEDDNAPRWRLDCMLATRRLFHTGGYTLVYDLQNSRRTRFYRRHLAPADTVWSQHHRCHRSVTGRHAVQLRAAGLSARHTPHPSPEWITDDAGILLREAGIAPGFVVLLPGSSARNAHKRWPYYAELSHWLQAADLKAVTIPGIDEADLGPEFSGIVLKRERRVLNLHELAGVLKAADVVVGNDSGPTHLSACLGTRCVALFDSDNPALISTDIAGRGAICLMAKPLRSIPLDAVVKAVLRQSVLNQGSGG